MAFTLNTFQYGRGVTTCAVNGNGVSTVTHGYKTNDTFATVAGASYFPAYIDGSTDNVFVGDFISIVASDIAAICLITALDPFAIGADLYAGAGSPVVMSVPVAATDANGIQITGSTVQLEIADATHPGIVTALAQVFAGIKMFNSGLTLLTTGGTPSTLNYYETADYVTTFTNNAETTNAMTFKLVRVGNSIVMRNTVVGAAAGQGAPVNAFTANTVLPARFRPAQECIGTWFVANGAVYKVGAILIEPTGAVSIYNDPNLTTTFTIAEISSLGLSSLAYTV